MVEEAVITCESREILRFAQNDILRSCRLAQNDSPRSCHSERSEESPVTNE